MAWTVIMNNLWQAQDIGSASVLILLDLLAGFNTIDWNIFLDLPRRLGVRGPLVFLPSRPVPVTVGGRRKGPALDLHIVGCFRT